jgi:hypothetical protein
MNDGAASYHFRGMAADSGLDDVLAGTTFCRVRRSPTVGEELSRICGEERRRSRPKLAGSAA